MAHAKTPGRMPCLFCGRVFRAVRALTQHLDTDHPSWVQAVMNRIGLQAPESYPVREYRWELARIFAVLDGSSAAD
jgi:hypothetical protein